MKLFTSIAAAAVIGAAGVLATAPAAFAAPSRQETATACNYWPDKDPEMLDALNINCNGYTTASAPRPAATYTAPAPRPVTKPAAPRPVTATNTTTNTNDSALRSGHGNRPSRSTTGSTGSTRNKAEIACPPGQQYAHIKIGGLLFKQTAFKGCGTPSTIAYWEHQKRADMNRRWANFGKGVADAAKAYGDSIQNSLPTYTTCNTRLNGFGGATSTCSSF